MNPFHTHEPRETNMDKIPCNILPEGHWCHGGTRTVNHAIHSPATYPLDHYKSKQCDYSGDERNDYDNSFINMRIRESKAFTNIMNIEKGSYSTEFISFLFL